MQVLPAFGPAVPRVLDPPPPASMTGRALAGVRVLVVDDSDINLEVIRVILGREDAEVTLATNGQEALEGLRARPDAFDIVLMDVRMPILDGCEATGRIRAELGQMSLPILAMTAGGLSAERQRAAAAGMNDFISKPFDAATLVSCVLRHAAKARARSAVMGTLPPAVAWPQIDGIDSHDARGRWCGDLPLFRSMLERFLEEFSDIADPASRDVPRRLSIDEVRLHKLRGGACMLGALRLQQIAGAAEAACADGDIALVEQLCQKLADEVEETRASAAAAFAAR